MQIDHFKLQGKVCKPTTDQQNASLKTRSLFGAIGLLSGLGCIAAFSNILNADGSLWWNLCTLIQALAIGALFLGAAIERGS